MKVGLVGDSLTEGRPGVSFSKILQKQYPHLTFDNLGKPGETVRSLHDRLIKTPIDSDYDLIFLWIGVNDVYSKLLKVQAQPVSRDLEEFKDVFQKVVEVVLHSSKQVVTVSPALAGENLNSKPTNDLEVLTEAIQLISSNYPQVEFLDLQSVFREHLKKVTSSDYLNTKVMRVMIDALFYKDPIRIDRLSNKRGLHYTLDGIHLNSRGAALVAEEYARLIGAGL
ncbi:GDSL-type esterase/lipase family protein [Sporosarcina thermotolerans]|uniref:GDSL-type esterase/lipase family protein n=1 Tax=Sporosarcina thermotolerans TaxID=633404 RepID=A0AAW9A9I1_9BACL|nr:GDSL-type esterase/lipase family protein [Sporosarcina thermotolerans]MDW0117714.1 GDSL-type esterase/lipase family protein [Sporosarcina thermotolerans]WHT49195.1 GDSL-type esterase/lipase family protein [Sporosarcina thermotolerans]